jgi:hypothetical protein
MLGVLAVLCVHEAIRDVLVTSCEPLIDSRGTSQPTAWAPWDIKTCSPDDFLHAMVDFSPEDRLRAFPKRSPTASSCHRWTSTRCSPRLSNQGLIETVAALRS